MNFDDVKKKIQNINWKAFFTSRNFVIVCSVLILGAAIIVYTAATSGGGDIDTKGGSKTLGNTVLVGGDASEADTENEKDSFFAVSVINRERTRDEAMDVLQTIADSPDTMPDARQEALLSITAMVEEMNAETNIETLVKAKGFEECVAIISGEKCSVIIKAEELLPDEAAQILEIAVEQSGLPATAIKIIPK
ncbi:MAG: SpoIIIAH-like family protein [Clostridiales bacterium]|jgi:stage III sporulation protein AH|nr:SpoIIIAH-like family protein [Clostridiales bacterium]